MKKTIYILILSLTTTICFSQVGIGTVNPQKELHIAGSTSTIRIESLNATNKPTYNDGFKPARAYVDGNGDITIGNGTGASGQVPLNFLIDAPDFILDSPYGFLGTGTVVNSIVGVSSAEGLITTVEFTVPQDAIIEIKYGVTVFVSGTDLSTGFWSYIPYDQAVTFMTLIKVDIDSDGLTGTELTKEYGQNGQYFASFNQGAVGYPYMNGQAYLTVPSGTHTLYFYGRISDDSGSHTCIGYGGAQDYLKIRVYN